MRRLTPLLLAAAAMASPASAATLISEIEVTGSSFSAPYFTFRNLSSAGVQITKATISGTVLWDFVNSNTIVNPAGGSRTLLIGEESSGNPNNGCTTSISYGLSNFDSGELFRYAADPEPGGCQNAVHNIKSYLEGGLITATIEFSDGTVLSGNNWIKTLIVPGGGTSDSNLLYRLGLSKVTANAVPEPASWAMMLAGFAVVGATMRRKAHGKRSLAGAR